MSSAPVTVGGVSPYAVPVTGPATVRAADPPRDSSVEFSDGVTTVSLPVREALPVLARARRGGRPHPTVALLAEAGLLALRLVGAGRFEPGDGRWLPSALDPDEDARVRRLAAEAAYDEWPPRRPSPRCATWSRPWSTRCPAAHRGITSTTFRRRLDAELVRPRRTPDGGASLPALVTISLRVEADEEELVAGAVRLVLQVHDELDALHLCDAALLWTGTSDDHGFGERARTHAAIALRAAAHAWPVLDRLLELRVPDEITLDTDELVSLLDDGVAALRRVGVDVLWPRSLGRDLTTRAALEHRDERPQGGPADDRAVRPGGDVRVQVAGGAPRRTPQRRRDAPAGERGQPGPQAARRLDRRRPAHRAQGQEAADPHRHPGAGGRGRAHRHGRGRARRAGGRGRGQPAARPRAAARRRDPRAPSTRPPACGRRCATTSGTASPGSTSSPRSASAAAWPTTWASARPSP